MQDRHINTASHGRIHILESGSGDPVILLHSNGHSAYEYEEVFPYLTDRFRVIAWDQPGHGDSERLARHYSVDDYADAVVELMNAMGLAGASVAGSSIGGAIAANLGVRHPDRINKLFVVEAPMRNAEQWQERWLPTELGYALVTQTRDQVAPRLRHLDDAGLTRWNIDRNKAGSWTMMDVMWALREYDIVPQLPLIRADTTVIYGDKTPHPAALKVFSATIPGAKGVEMKDCGHFPMMDDPVEFARVIVGAHG